MASHCYYAGGSSVQDSGKSPWECNHVIAIRARYWAGSLKFRSKRLRDEGDDPVNRKNGRLRARHMSVPLQPQIFAAMAFVTHCVKCVDLSGVLPDSLPHYVVRPDLRLPNFQSRTSEEDLLGEVPALVSIRDHCQAAAPRRNCGGGPDRLGIRVRRVNRTIRFFRILFTFASDLRHVSWTRARF